MKLSQSYLESVSTDELLQLAELYGLFVPSGLNRSFIIRELLDIDDYNYTGTDKSAEADTEKYCISTGLPASYNSTEISVIIRDPMWLFVFWDFCKAEFEELTKNEKFDSFVLRVLLFAEGERTAPYDYYDVDIKKTDRSRYIHLSFDDIVTRIKLCARFEKNELRVLAESGFSELKRSNIPARLGSIDGFSDSVYFAGLSVLKKRHFKHYRQAFEFKEEAGVEHQ